MNTYNIPAAMNTFSERLSDLISEADDDLRTLSDKIGIPKSTLSDYTNIKREPRITELAKIASYFNVSADYLLGISDVRSQNITIQEIAQFTGLTEKSITALHRSSEIIHRRLIPEKVSSLRDAARRIASDEIEDDREYLIEEIVVRESQIIDAINSLIAKEHEFHILENISMYLSSYVRPTARIFFAFHSPTSGEGSDYTFPSDILISGMISNINTGLQKMREVSEKKYLMCDIEADEKNKCYYEECSDNGSEDSPEERIEYDEE